MYCCFLEVVWCDEQCRLKDVECYEFECLWLKKMLREICSLYGDSEFVLMWFIIWIFINRYFKNERSYDMVFLQLESDLIDCRVEDVLYNSNQFY